MNKEEMLSRIYEVIADKTFKYWLNIIRNGMSKEKVVCIKSLADWRFRLETFAPSSFNQYWIFISLRELEDIICIWHDVMIGNILEYSKRFSDFYDEVNGVMNLKDRVHQYLPRYRLDMTKAIDDQSDECIKFIYDIIANA